MKYDSLIFDIDGTLWNTLSVCTDAWNEGLHSLGVSKRITINDLKGVVGQPWNQCAELLFPDLIFIYPNVYEILDYYEKKAITKYGGKLYPNVQEGLVKLSNKFKLFLISNCQEWYLKQFLEQTKFDSLFIDYDCYGISNQPKSIMIKNIIEKHTLSYPVYIGDTDGDQLAATKANIDFIHADWGYGKVIYECMSFKSFSELTYELLDIRH